MKTLAVLWCTLLGLAAAQAGQKINYSLGDFDMLHGGNPAFSKTQVDTVYLIGPWGSGAQANGQFENPTGSPAWNGWTHYDLTQDGESHWQLSDYHAENLPGGQGNLAAWCGDLDIPPCSEDDPPGGYGNSWSDLIEWRGQVSNPALGASVHFSASANIDSEPGYDYTYIRYLGQEGWVEAAAFDGAQPNLAINVQFSLEPADYQGQAGDEVIIQVHFQSDGAWSDTDCLHPSAGAIQIDIDITVVLDQEPGLITSFTDFEDGWGDWMISIPPGVGDFSQIWTNLQDIDPCGYNFSPQVAFIDDGLVVPGVGPSYCINWCYGPNGYIVNTTGGAVGPDAILYLGVESPVVAWPGENYKGLVLRTGIYRHEDLGADAPGIFYRTAIRSTGSADPADIELENFFHKEFVYYGGPDYIDMSENYTGYIDPGIKFIQARVEVHELGYVWDWTGNDGYPAPYFDNIRLLCFPHYGPGMSTREIDLANDNFPAIGEVDLVNLGNNSVRFDMANNSSLAAHLTNNPGDSIVCNISSVRDGAEFVGEPELHWRLRRNPVFDPYRTSEYGDADQGVSPGFPSTNYSGDPIPDRWAFDLPDSNFLFPGDVLHYFIKATDDDGLEEQSAFMPPDTTGFSDFRRALSYNSSYTVRALPSVLGDPLNPGVFETPKVLFWNDFANRGGQNEWHGALSALGLVLGLDYDCYYTNGPSSGVGNGLGGRATQYSLVGYQDLLYTAGDLSVNTISNGDFNNDPGNDIEVLDSWLRFGGKDIFLTGDDLVYDLSANAGAAAGQFVDDWFKVDFVGNDLRPLINNQTTPLVQAIPGNGILISVSSWLAYGGCRGINTFDAVIADAEVGAVRLAEFTNPAGAGGQYEFSAATYYHDTAHDARVLSLPYDLMFVYDAPEGLKTNASLPARARLLRDVLALFGIEGRPEDVTPVPEARAFAVRSYPNPFNPQVNIEYTVPRPDRLTLKVFDVRGRLVRTLMDDRAETDGRIAWDGTDDQGLTVGSGVYFCEARCGAQVKVEKVTLLK